MGLYTVNKASEGIYKEKGSKFFSFLQSVASEDSAKEIIAEISNVHHKSKYVCYALRIGENGEFERTNDAGEPKGSAGAPILNQLYSAELTNVILIVVRYFGGTKLGLGGLNKAYKLAALNSIENSVLIKNVVYNTLRITFPYEDLGKLKRVIEQNNWIINEAIYEDPCRFTISSPQLSVEEMKSKLSHISSVQIQG